MQSAQDALERLEVSTGAHPQGEVKLFIYDSAQELQESLVFPQEWTGGVSFTGFDIVAIGIPPGSLTWEKSNMANAPCMWRSVTVSPKRPCATTVPSAR